MALNTSEVGLTPQGGVVIYAPPNATVVPPGSTVSYGPWVTLEEGDALPNAPVIIEVEAGAAPLQAANQVVYRTVTLVPV